MTVIAVRLCLMRTGNTVFAVTLPSNLLPSIAVVRLVLILCMLTDAEPLDEVRDITNMETPPPASVAKTCRPMLTIFITDKFDIAINVALETSETFPTGPSLEVTAVWTSALLVSGPNAPPMWTGTPPMYMGQTAGGQTIPVLKPYSLTVLIHDSLWTAHVAPTTPGLVATKLLILA